MRTKVAMMRQAAGFERVLESLGEELIESTDEELLQAARDLGMDPMMRGSAAFIGLKYPGAPRLSDFFAVDPFEPRRIATERAPDSLPPSKKRLTDQRKLRKPPRGRNRSDSE